MIDITTITNKVKSYCYQDLYQKPSEVLLYRRVDEGGLGLFHIQSKAQAHLVATFLQTAANSKYNLSLFHSWLYRFHVLGESELPNPGFTPYYDQKFFDIIKFVKENTPLNPIYMSMKEWYRVLLETNLTKREVTRGGQYAGAGSL